MSEQLRRLIPQARMLITKESFRDQSFGNLDGYIEDLPRAIDLAPLVRVVQTAMQIFSARDEESDGWLAPRVHASLRLFRSEAADQGIWDYLSVVTLRDYVLWRMAGEDGLVTDVDSIIGPFRHQAVARLWWAPELSRNGSDYRPTEQAFSSQDAVNYLTNVDAFHNRPAALAYIRFISHKSGDKPIKQRAIQTGKTLNHVLTTIVLDSFAPDSDSDMNAQERWIGAAPDMTLPNSTLPQGPDEPQVPEEKISEVEQLLEGLMEEHHLFETVSQAEEISAAITAPGLTVSLETVELAGNELVAAPQAEDAARTVSTEPTNVSVTEIPAHPEPSLAGQPGSGVADATIVEKAESVFEKLTPEQQSLARKILLQLTELGEGAPDTARSVAAAELIPRPESTPLVDAMLKLLADAHLITSDENAVQIADQALISGWKRLREWLAEDREGLRLQRQLADAAKVWESMQRDPNLLFRGARLAQALEWAAANRADLGAREREFLDASKAVAESAVQNLAQAETRRAAEEHRAAMQWRKRAFIFAAALIALTLITAAIVYLAFLP